LPTVIDATDLENIGHFRFWFDLHNISSANLALLTSVTLRWGNNSSNYWEATATTTVNNGSFKTGWNKLDFDWDSATATGSPDASALDYFLIRVTYDSTFTDTNNIRVDDLVLIEPQTMEIVYFSTSFVNNGGTWQTRFTTATVDSTEILLLPDRHLETFVKLSLRKLFPQKERKNDDYIRVVQESNDLLEDMVLDIGNEIVRESDTLRPLGEMHGRIDNSSNHW
jgi:hypothetical protein